MATFYCGIYVACQVTEGRRVDGWCEEDVGATYRLEDAFVGHIVRQVIDCSCHSQSMRRPINTPCGALWCSGYSTLAFGSIGHGFEYTEVDRPRRPTGYIPTPANANFALESDAMRGQLKFLYPATRRSRGQYPIDRNAMKTRKKRNTDGSL